jgi:hypothetical protein
MNANSGPLAGVRRFLVPVCVFAPGPSPGLATRSERLSTERRGGTTFSGMRRAAEILTTLVLFAGVMSAIGWAAGAIVI